MTNILPLQQNYQLVDKDGNYTPAFKRYLDSLLARVGGITGGTYTALSVNSGGFLWDLNQAPVAVITLDNGVNTLDTPLNLVAGLLYRLTIIQPGSGAPGTIAWPRPPMVFPGGTAPTLSTANGAIDELWFTCDGTNLKLCVEALNFS